MDDKIRLILVDDHLLFRIGLKGILASESDRYEVVGEAGSANELFSFLPNTQADIILLDLILPNISGTEIASILRKDYPALKILVLSAESDINTISQLIDIGINGFISKDIASIELIHAIECVMNDEEYYGNDIARIIQYVRTAKKHISDNVFTQRENEIIVLCAKGLQAKEIAKRLGISSGTVNTHKNNIFRKLGINNSVELVNYCVQNGLVHI